MSDLTIWHDPQRDKWYVQHKHQLEEILPLTLEYMKDMHAENDKLNERIAHIEQHNKRLRELVDKMTRALGVGSGWCIFGCIRELNCVHVEKCPIVTALEEEGIKVDA